MSRGNPGLGYHSAPKFSNYEFMYELDWYAGSVEDKKNKNILLWTCRTCRDHPHIQQLLIHHSHHLHQCSQRHPLIPLLSHSHHKQPEAIGETTQIKDQHLPINLENSNMELHLEKTNTVHLNYLASSSKNRRKRLDIVPR